MRRLAAFALLITCVTTTTALGQSTPAAAPPFRLRVKLTFGTSEVDVLKSALARELRRLDSVEIVDDDTADNTLSIVVVLSAGLYAASVVLVGKADMATPLYFSDSEACWPTEKQQNETQAFCSDYVTLDDQWVFTGRDLSGLATRIAAAVDVNDVEAHRQRYRRLEERRRLRQPKKP
jgi:hypothetical protein